VVLSGKAEIVVKTRHVFHRPLENWGEFPEATSRNLKWKRTYDPHCSAGPGVQAV